MLAPGEEAIVAEVRLNRFTELNSLHGSEVGDAALRAVGSALTRAVGHGGFALVRWAHPTFGAVGPERFIPLAEESGTIHELGAHVLEVACGHVARWRGLRPELPCTVSVNVSAAQLDDASFADRVRVTLARHRVAPAA